MLSIELIRKDPEGVRKALLNRGEEAGLEALLALDARRRELISQGDELRSRRNQVSKEIGRLAREPSQAAQTELLKSEMRAAGERIDQAEKEVKALDEKIHATLLTLPNIALPDVPVGMGEENNRVVRTWGEKPKFDFQPQPVWELAEKLGILDMERGAKLAGARFYVLKEKGARLQRSLIQFFLNTHTQEHGYKEMYLPYLVREEVMVASSNLPKFAENLYHDAEEDLWLVPTAEVPLTSLHKDEILEASQLPIHYVAHTPCFRREKTAAGRDVRGIKRVHQFEKVEMYKFVLPETSEGELTKMVGDAEAIIQRLGLPYRVLQLCTGELGFASAKSFDLEMWAPGSAEWLEVSSCSNVTDFQARRANVRYRPTPGARPQYVHTLNGSGLALPRVIIAILENFQQADGSVVIPEVLRPYTGFDRITPV